MKIFRKLSVLILTVLLTFIFCFTAFAQDIPTFSESGKILSVAHGGNTQYYPKNSIAAIQSAFEIGSDFVSVDVKRTADNCFILADSDSLGDNSLEGYEMIISMLPASQVKSIHMNDKTGKISEYLFADLSEALKAALMYDKILMIDCDWEDREAVYSVICENDANNNAVIRTDKNQKDIHEFTGSTNSNCDVIGQYHGNIIFNARKYITSLSKEGCKIVFLGTKNSFGTIFRSGVLSAFAITGYSSRAAIKTYDPNESGNRPDCESTWDDVIDRGYSVIETDRISDLLSYIEKLYSERTELSALLSQAQNTEPAFLTAQSVKAINDAADRAAYELSTISSFKSLSLAKSNLNLALFNKESSNTAENSNKGVLSVTAGKIIAIVLVAAALIFVQIYFYYKQANKKQPKWFKKLFRK